MKIVWTEPAVEDLHELHAYIARDSEVYASGFVERIILAAERLVDYPRTIRELGALYPRQMTKTFGSSFINDIASSIASRAIVLKCCQ
jgi:plasmid stabilization system protein ParE